MSDTLYLLSGPTAVGKTALSLEWAEANDAEILSCDSLLFYKGMDIGTAKPSSEERTRVPHHGIDLVLASQQYNISSYIEYAQGVIADLHLRGKKVLITGGSGFYLKAFLAPVVDDVEVSQEITKHVLDLYDEKGLEGLMAELMKLNPDGVGDLDIYNSRRVIKALGRCMTSGKSALELKSDFEAQDLPFGDYNTDVVILEREPEHLKTRIAKRVYLMLEGGLIEEVRELIEKGINDNPSAARAIGYRETIQWIEEGKTDLEELAQEIILDTNRLVAKQRKWFRNQIKGARLINLDEHLLMTYKDLF